MLCQSITFCFEFLKYKKCKKKKNTFINVDNSMYAIFLPVSFDRDINTYLLQYTAAVTKWYMNGVKDNRVHAAAICWNVIP